MHKPITTLIAVALTLGCALPSLLAEDKAPATPPAAKEEKHQFSGTLTVVNVDANKAVTSVNVSKAHGKKDPEVKIFVVNADTKVKQGKKDLALTDLAVDQKVTVDYKTDKDVMTAIKIAIKEEKKEGEAAAPTK